MIKADRVELAMAMVMARVIEEGDNNKENIPPCPSQGALVLHLKLYLILTFGTSAVSFGGHQRTYNVIEESDDDAEGKPCIFESCA